MSSEDDLQPSGRSYVNDCHIATSATVENQFIDAGYDFIFFLAIAQKLEIDFLLITWQSTREVIGIGETVRIDQAFLNLQTSLAFKRIKKINKDNLELIFQVLISEMIVLSHPAIRRHSNIVELQGICWDIPSDDEIWSVLVLKKSHFEDLYDFLRLSIERDLNINERLKFCLNIGVAIENMHSNCTKYKVQLMQRSSLNLYLAIIHGDIKPQNVLIFKNNHGTFTSRVTDFGYSTWFASENDFIKLSVSKSWNAPKNAPENGKCSVKPCQARKMDVFFLVCCAFWFYLKNIFSKRHHFRKSHYWFKLMIHIRASSFSKLWRIKIN